MKNVILASLVGGGAVQYRRLQRQPAPTARQTQSTNPPATEQPAPAELGH